METLVYLFSPPLPFSQKWGDDKLFTDPLSPLSNRTYYNFFRCFHQQYVTVTYLFSQVKYFNWWYRKFQIWVFQKYYKLCRNRNIRVKMGYKRKDFEKNAQNFSKIGIQFRPLSFWWQIIFPWIFAKNYSKNSNPF